MFKFLKEKGVNLSGIKTRKNVVVKARSERAESVLQFQKYDYNRGRTVHQYGII